MSKLAGKVAVVTGASKGIGAGIAKSLAKEGAAVVVNYATAKQDADKVVAEIKKSNGKAIAVQADVSKKKDIDRLFAETKAAFGKLDILVNNAAIYSFAPLEEITEEHYRKHFDLNVLGLLLTTQEGVKLMDGDGGSVINVSSISAITPPATTSVYSATKGAVDVITRVLAQELGSKKVRVNSLSPGLVETEGTRTLGTVEGEFKDSAVSRTPLGRVGQPDDIGRAAVFLASEDSGWITGEVIPVGGGVRL